VFFNCLSVCRFVCVCLFVCLFVLFLYNYLLLLSHNLIFNLLLEGLKLVHTGVQQILWHVVHFVFYMFLVCVAIFGNASSVFNTESHVFVVLSVPFLLPVL